MADFTYSTYEGEFMGCEMRSECFDGFRQLQEEDAGGLMVHNRLDLECEKS